MLIQIVLTFIASETNFVHLTSKWKKNKYFYSQISDFLACEGFKLANADIATAHKIITQSSFISLVTLALGAL